MIKLALFLIIFNINQQRTFFISKNMYRPHLQPAGTDMNDSTPGKTKQTTFFTSNHGHLRHASINQLHKNAEAVVPPSPSPPPKTTNIHIHICMYSFMRPVLLHVSFACNARSAVKNIRRCLDM